MQQNVIIWFQNNLRIHDNEVLHTAAQKGLGVIGFVCFDDFWFAKTPYGFTKTGPYRLKFWLESVAQLASQINKLGGKMVVVKGDTAAELLKLSELTSTQLVYAERAITHEERQLQNRVMQTAKDAKFSWFYSETLYHPNDLPHPIAQTPDIFTKFRHGVEKKSSIRPCFPTPTKLATPDVSLPEQTPVQLSDFNLTLPKVDERAVLPFIGGELQALKRLDHYFFQTLSLKQYKLTRNGLLGADFSSKFSPWLAFGCISPRFIYQKVKEFEQEITANDSTYWLIFELIWRDYFKFYALKHGNAIFKLNGPKQQTPEVKTNHQWLEAWYTGNTGIPFIDANMRELNASGFMSNRGRQNVASFLVKDLKQDWRAGAAYFEHMLIDYDVCSNYGNWNYVAGVGADPREDRYFNVLLQAINYDRDAKYVKHWLPELADLDAKQVVDWSKGNTTKSLDYPKPIKVPSAFHKITL